MRPVVAARRPLSSSSSPSLLSSGSSTSRRRRPVLLALASGVSAAALLLLVTRKVSPTMGTTSTQTPSAAATSPPPPPSAFSSFDFEVFGKVQGVYFRQHVTDKADEINEKARAETGIFPTLVGWVRNTAAGSVEGVAQSSSPQALAEFEHFVTKVGSPASRIDRFEVRNRRGVEKLEFEKFERSTRDALLMRSRLSNKLTRLVSSVAADSSNSNPFLGCSSSSNLQQLLLSSSSPVLRPSIAAAFFSSSMRISSSTASAPPLAASAPPLAASATKMPPRATVAARSAIHGGSRSAPSRGGVAAASALLRSSAFSSIASSSRRTFLASPMTMPMAPSFLSSSSSSPIACAASRRNSSSSANADGSSTPHPPPLRTVPGIGAKAELLLAAAGIGTVADLVRAFRARAASSKPQMVSFLQDEVGIRHGRYANKIADHVADIHDETSREQEEAAKAAEEGSSVASSADRRLRAAAADRRVTLCVEGNISAGKSSFLRFIADECVELQDVIEVVPEPVDKWQAVGPDRVNVLEQFYANPERYAYTFQNYVFVTRMMQERESAAGSSALRLLERSVFSDRMVFVRAVHEARWMSDMELDIYDSWFDPVVSALPALAPDGFIYLRATPGTCAARMGRRGRGEEGGVSLGYLEGLHEKHDAWLAEPSLLGLGSSSAAAAAAAAAAAGGREIRLSASAMRNGSSSSSSATGAFAAPTSSPSLALPPAVLSPDGRGVLSSSLLLPRDSASASPPGLLDMGSRVRVGSSGASAGSTQQPSTIDPAALIPEPPEIAGRVYYLDSARQAGLHSAVDRVPALLLDCDRDIDLKHDLEAKAHYGRQVAAYFGHVRRVRAARRAAAAAAGGSGATEPLSAAEAGKRATALAAAAEAMFGGGNGGGGGGRGGSGVLRADPSVLQRVLREQQQQSGGGGGGRRRASG